MAFPFSVRQLFPLNHSSTVRAALCAVLFAFPLGCAHAQPDLPASSATGAGSTPGALVIEAEDFKPVGSTPGAAANNWKTVFNGQGNYIVDTIGYTHISGERLLSAPANANGASALTSVVVPAAGDYKLWARFEQPVGTKNRFIVKVRQAGRPEFSATFGEAAANKIFFGLWPTAESGAPWGWQGLVEQGFEIKGLQAGPAEIELVAPEQPEPRADRNVDFLFLTNDLTDSWRGAYKSNPRYPILDAALAALPTRYYLRLTSPTPQTLSVNWKWNRIPWRASEGNYIVQANAPGAWMPLRKQDVSHFSTLLIQAPRAKGLNLRVELSADAQGKRILRTIDWNDPDSNELLISLPPYPGKYPGEPIMTADEQYRAIAAYLARNAPTGGREPKLAINQGSMPLWERGRLGDAAGDVYHAMGMRGFLNFVRADGAWISARDAVGRERFARWGMQPNRSVAVGAFRQFPTPENVAQVKAAVDASGVLPLVQRFDYGDEITFGEWLKPFSDEEIKTAFAAWQQKHKGKTLFDMPDSSRRASETDPVLFVDSTRFYEDFALQSVANQARLIPETLGKDVLFGANYLAHPYYYPRIAPYIKWFRPTENGAVAANFGRHSEYFWQVHQPGPMVNGYMAEHFRAGMRDNPQAVNLQYTMPHSPGNTDESFRRTAFTHLAHGARGLDFFDIGLNSSDTENYIDFRDPARYAAIRDINRAVATIEDILPTSRVVPGKVALILSDSTERWDLAHISANRGGVTIEGIAGITANDARIRLSYHQERLGIYYALVNNNRPPDLLTEDDVTNGRIGEYSVAYWVGDCAAPATVSALRAWVENGGHLVATAGALRFDEYHQPVSSGRELLGLQTSELNEATRFVRPLIELPRLKPLDVAEGMPALAVLDTVTAAPNAQVALTFKSGAPAVVRSTPGRGRTTYIATLPGLAYLWSAYQPPPIPSRGPSSHVLPVDFNATAERIILDAARSVAPQIDTHGARIDARLLASPNGYAIPLANYNANVETPIVLTIGHINGLKIGKISSSRRGDLKLEREANGDVTVRFAPGIGDILRIEP